jgi:hypothetical protein
MKAYKKVLKQALKQAGFSNGFILKPLLIEFLYMAINWKEVMSEYLVGLRRKSMLIRVSFRTTKLVHPVYCFKHQNQAS